MSASRIVTGFIFACYAALLLVVSLCPTPIDGQGILESLKIEILQFTSGVSWLSWFQYNQLEALSNVILYVPMGILVSLLLARFRNPFVFLIPAAVSGVLEIAQGLFLSSRYCSFMDVLNNSIGGALGIVIALSIRRWMRS